VQGQIDEARLLLEESLSIKRWGKAVAWAVYLCIFVWFGSLFLLC
jgi:hypothetical protein